MLYRHPKVMEAAVVARPDEKWGECVHAVIVLHEGATLEEGDLKEWSKERLAGYKRPSRIPVPTTCPSTPAERSCGTSSREQASGELGQP